MADSKDNAEVVLVFGGCGFVGYNIVKTLRQQEPSWHLHAASRNPKRNLIQDVEYHACNISSYEQVAKLLDGISPTVIIHAASPPVVGDRADEDDCHQTNIDGTRCLLDCALAQQSTKAFVYTSSAMAVEGAAHHMSTEDTALLRSQATKCDKYSKSKGIADQMVQDANGKKGMLTACLRLPSTYGDRDEQNIAEGIKAMRRGEQRLQIGDNSNMCDWLSASNAAKAHHLAVKALLDEHARINRSDGLPERSVGGQAFFITDGEALPFWDHFRIIWKAAGDRTAPDQVTKIPPRLIMSIAAIVEFAYYVFTLGTRKPKALRRDLLELTFLERTFSIEKARQRLGYEPARDRNEQMLEGVRWYIGQYPA